MIKTNFQENKISILKLFFLILESNNNLRKKQFIISIILIIFSAISEMISLGFTLTFLGSLTSKTELIEYSPFFKNVFSYIGIGNEYSDPFYSTIIFCILIVNSALFKMLSFFTIEKVAAGIGVDYCHEIFKLSIYKPYKDHLSTNSSEIITAISSYLDKAIGVIRFLLRGLSSLLISFSILLTLFLIDFQLTLISLIIFLSIYYLITLFTNNQVLISGRKESLSYQMQTKLIQESLNSIKEIIIGSFQETFLLEVDNFEKAKRNAKVKINFLSSFPKFILEPLALTLISILSFLFYKSNQSNLTGLIPLLGTLAFGCQKLLPAIQTSFDSFIKIKGMKYSTLKVLDIIQRSKKRDNYTFGKDKGFFFKEIKFENVFFKYKNLDKNFVIDNLNISFKRGEKVRIIGKTGCGKSTFIDLLLGLLTPNNGKIIVNNKDINEQPILLNQLHQITSYVQQNVYLTDNTIAENIAFGIPEKFIDYEKVRFAAKLANIDDFISNLPYKYKTLAGEGGLKLSGGQKQRLAIARALYRDPQILVLDESTSALDRKTELEVFYSIQNLKKINDMTIILITHQTSPLIDFDRSLIMNNGKLFEENK